MPAPNSNGPPLDVDAVISTTMEAILYGFSVLMYGLTIWVLVRQNRAGGFNVTMIGVACLLFVLSTIHMGIDIDRLYRGFVQLRGDNQLLDFYGDISQMTFIFKNSVYSFQTVLGDSVVIYRAYIVWQSFWPIILPSLLLGAVIATAVGSVFTASLATPGSSLSLFEQSGTWITAFFSSTLACNLLGTMTLAYRLWTLDRSLRHIRSQQISLMPVVLICVDSGLLYSISLMSALILLVRGSRAQFIVLDMISPIISISFYAIILRVSRVKAEREREARRASVQPPGNRGPPGELTNASLSFAARSAQLAFSHSHSGSGGQSVSFVRSDAHAYPPSPLIDLEIQSGKLEASGDTSVDSPVERHQKEWHAL